MINPSREHYWVLSGCAFSLPVIVLFLLLPSSVSPLIIWKEGKMSEWSREIFPQSLNTEKYAIVAKFPSQYPAAQSAVVWGTMFLVTVCDWVTGFFFFFHLKSDWLSVQLNVTLKSVQSAGSHGWLFVSGLKWESWPARGTRMVYEMVERQKIFWGAMPRLVRSSTGINRWFLVLLSYVWYSTMTKHFTNVCTPGCSKSTMSKHLKGSHSVERYTVFNVLYYYII